LASFFDLHCCTGFSKKITKKRSLSALRNAKATAYKKPVKYSVLWNDLSADRHGIKTQLAVAWLGLAWLGLAWQLWHKTAQKSSFFQNIFQKTQPSANPPSHIAKTIHAQVIQRMT